MPEGVSARAPRIPLPPVFSGQTKGWRRWRHQMEAYCNATGMKQAMMMSEHASSDQHFKLYATLTAPLPEELLDVIRRHLNDNATSGGQAWAALRTRFEGGHLGRISDMYAVLQSGQQRTETAEAYYHRLDNAFLDLVAEAEEHEDVEAPSHNQVVTQFLAGLRPEYEPIIGILQVTAEHEGRAITWEADSSMDRLLAESVSGITFAKDEILPFCDCCALAKSHEQPRSRIASKRPTGPLQKFGADIWGPVGVTSIGGFRYVFGMADYYSAYGWVVFMKSKDEAPRALLLVNGLQEERMWLTLSEMTVAMLLHAGLGREFWALAFCAAMHIRNNVYSRGVGSVPYRRHTGKTQDVAGLRVFGCPAYVHMDAGNRRKLDAKAFRGVFVGYGQESHTYLALLDNSGVGSTSDASRLQEITEAHRRVVDETDDVEELEIEIEEGGQLICILVVDVDDMIFAFKDAVWAADFKMALGARFDIKDLGVCAWALGMAVERDWDNAMLKVHQAKYIDDMMHKFNLADAYAVSTPAEVGADVPGSNKPLAAEMPYQALVGSLLYAMVATRPDIAEAVSKLCRVMAKPEERHWQAAKRVLRYLKGTKTLGLTFSGGKADGLLHGYCDADWAGDVVSRRSTTGFVFMLCGAAVSWKSQLQATVALSTAEAEYMALCAAVCEALFLRELLRELCCAQSEASMIFEDNQSCIALTRNPMTHGRSKHIAIKYHFTREKVLSGEVAIEYCPTAQMVADALTKPLGRLKHAEFAMQMLGP
eukprot:jgi/Tetstr1/462169/TSEL_007234.t1